MSCRLVPPNPRCANSFAAASSTLSRRACFFDFPIAVGEADLVDRAAAGIAGLLRGYVVAEPDRVGISSHLGRFGRPARQCIRDHPAQRLLVDLTHPRDGEFGDRLHSFRELELRQPLALQEISKRMDPRHRLAWSWNNKGAGYHAEERVKHGNHAHIVDCRMAHDDVFDFFSAEFLSAAIDVVLHAAFKDVVIAPVDTNGAYKVAGPEETIRREAFGGDRRGIEIGPQAVRTAKTQLAGLARRSRLLACGLEHASLIVNASRPAERSVARRLGVARPGGHEHALGNAIDLMAFDPGLLLHRLRPRDSEEEPHGAEVIPVDIRTFDDARRNRADAAGIGHAES